jgi:hypothetical protein
MTKTKQTTDPEISGDMKRINTKRYSTYRKINKKEENFCKC